MSNTEGLVKKYEVHRLNDTKGKHDNCRYFVLDLDHDRFAIPTLLAYATVCEQEYPALARDLRALLKETEGRWRDFDDPEIR